MLHRHPRTTSLSLGSLACLGLALGGLQGVLAAQDGPAPARAERCTVNLAKAGKMKDIVSNALVLGIRKPESQVRAFLDGAEKTYGSGPELLRAAAAHFELEEAFLKDQVQEFLHVNCGHGELPETPPLKDLPAEATAFAQDVLLHVVLHELGHALVREFDLPVLGNEETLADAFATHYLVTYLPERAPQVIEARVRSLMHEAGEVPREAWDVSGEHNSDARRAHQITALALAADRQAYWALAESLGMSERHMRSSGDYGSEIHRSWRRTLGPLWMPAGQGSTEVALGYDEGSELLGPLLKDGLAQEVLAVLRRFDWHSQVRVTFAEYGDGAGWSRSKRTVTVGGDYVRRFLRQGLALQAEE